MLRLDRARLHLEHALQVGFCDVVPFSQVVAFLCADEEAGAAAVEAAPD
jgi:hypothetical protein